MFKLDVVIYTYTIFEKVFKTQWR